MHERSLAGGDAIPAVRTFDSAQLGWSSVLCRGYAEEPVVEQLITVPTPDLCLVAITGGTYAAESWRHKRWNSGVYARGSVAMNLPDESSVVRWRTITAEPLSSIHVHIDAATVADTAAALDVDPRPELGPRIDLEDPFVFEACSALGRAAVDQASSLYADAIAHALAAHVLAGRAVVGVTQSGAPPNAATLRAGALADVVEFMHANLSVPLSLEQLAAVAYLSKWHFLRQFKASTGLTPHAYLVRLRVEEAQRRLRAGSTPAAVAIECGFGSHSQLARAFRRLLDCTPTEFCKHSA